MKSKKPEHIACPHRLILMATSLLLALSSGSNALLLPASSRAVRARGTSHAAFGARNVLLYRGRNANRKHDNDDASSSLSRRRRRRIQIRPSSCQFGSSTPPSSSSSSSSSSSRAEDVDGVPRGDDGRRGGTRTALLWLSRNRLRLMDNAALKRASELGPDGLAIVLEAWPWQHERRRWGEEEEGLEEGEEGKDVDPETTTLTPLDAFGYAATRSLYESLGKMGQKFWFVRAPRASPSRQRQRQPRRPRHDEGVGAGGGMGGLDDDRRAMVSVLAHAIHARLRPSYVVVDTSSLDRHRDRASMLLDELRRLGSSSEEDDDARKEEEEV